MHNEREKEAKRSNLLMTVELGPNGAFVPKVNWRVPTMPSYANPISHRGVAYWVNNAGIVTAFDTKSGKQFFAERIQQTCWAAPLGFGDRVYFFGKEGLTTVLKAGPEFRILAENGLWDAPASTGKPGGDEHGGHGKKPKTPADPQAKPPQTKENPDGKSPGKPGKDGDRTGPGSKMFADPIQYGVAVVNGNLVIRSGAVVYCIRQKK